MQMIARRNVVHVEVPDPSRRIDLMNLLLPYLPLLLALSVSSPFWQGQNTGLAGYRLSVWGELPRTGLPDLFADAAEYERYVKTMVAAGAIKDASFLW
jgi:glutamate---cysteine ligase / carboxylate-amine ligase